MTDKSASVSELRTALQKLDETVSDDSVSGYAKTAAFNLNGVALGLGLQDTVYIREDFPALIYYLEDETLLLFWDGVIACLDAPDEETVQQRIDETIENLEAVGFEREQEELPTATITDEIPVTPDYNPDGPSYTIQEQADSA